MPGRGSKNHVHKYHKIEIGANKVWACALSDCTHHMPAYMAAMVPGKKSICWECNKQFVLTEDNMDRDEPICTTCHLAERGINVEDTMKKIQERLDYKLVHGHFPEDAPSS